MNNLEIISINIWQILISLLNLIIIFLILKKFLFSPVRRVIADRTAKIESDYADAKAASEKAERDRTEWENTLKGARYDADSIIKKAETDATAMSEEIISEANKKAEGIINRARADADAEYRKAEAQIKHEIAGVSVAIAEKMLEREIDSEDHRKLIDSFIENIGDSDDADK